MSSYAASILHRFDIIRLRTLPFPLQNPTVQSVLPRRSQLSISRTLTPSLSPIPNITAVGEAGSVFAQYWYEGEVHCCCCARHSLPSDAAIVPPLPPHQASSSSTARPPTATKLSLRHPMEVRASGLAIRCAAPAAKAPISAPVCRWRPSSTGSAASSTLTAMQLGELAPSSSSSSSMCVS